MLTADEIRTYWDADAATYDDATSHRPTSPAECAAWAGALSRLLPPPPARVLDCGAGTGFLSLLAAREGHVVTALDLSGGMLDRLRAAAAAEDLEIDTYQGSAADPPPGPFDVIMERHLLWTLTDPVGALRSWRAVAPFGRLVLVEGLWGRADPAEVWRARGRKVARRFLRAHPDHHGAYPAEVAAELPWAQGTPPAALVQAVLDAGWSAPQLQRLRDVEWAARLDLPSPLRLLGVPPRFVVGAR